MRKRVVRKANVGVVPVQNVMAAVDFLPGIAAGIRASKAKKMSLGNAALIGYSATHAYHVITAKANANDPNYEVVLPPANCMQDVVKCYLENEIFRRTVNVKILSPGVWGLLALVDGTRKKDRFTQASGGILFLLSLFNLYGAYHGD